MNAPPPLSYFLFLNTPPVFFTCTMGRTGRDPCDLLLTRSSMKGADVYAWIVRDVLPLVDGNASGDSHDSTMCASWRPWGGEKKSRKTREEEGDKKARTKVRNSFIDECNPRFSNLVPTTLHTLGRLFCASSTPVFSLPLTLVGNVLSGPSGMVSSHWG